MLASCSWLANFFLKLKAPGCDACFLAKQVFPLTRPGEGRGMEEIVDLLLSMDAVELKIVRLLLPEFLLFMSLNEENAATAVGDFFMIHRLRLRELN